MIFFIAATLKLWGLLILLVPAFLGLIVVLASFSQYQYLVIFEGYDFFDALGISWNMVVSNLRSFFWRALVLNTIIAMLYISIFVLVFIAAVIVELTKSYFMILPAIVFGGVGITVLFVVVSMYIQWYSYLNFLQFRFKQLEVKK
jgi:hypothetical protein